MLGNNHQWIFIVKIRKKCYYENEVPKVEQETDVKEKKMGDPWEC